MKHVLRYITSVQIQNKQTEHMNVSLCFDENGMIGLYFQDAVELGQDSKYINHEAFPNSGLLVSGKYSMWLSMFTRHINMDFDDDDE